MMTILPNKRPAGIAILRGARQPGHIANIERRHLIIIILIVMM